MLKAEIERRVNQRYGHPGHGRLLNKEMREDMVSFIMKLLTIDENRATDQENTGPVNDSLIEPDNRKR